MESQKPKEPIIGIYNWCDRWCERCDFTDRCTLYAKDQEKREEYEDPDSPEAFMEMIKESLAESMEALGNLAEEIGFEPEEEEEKIEANFASWKEQDELISKSELVKLTGDYTKKAHQLISSSLHSELTEGLIQQTEMGILDEDTSSAKLSEIEEACDVIQWYMFMVHVKSKSAMQSFHSDSWDDYPEEEKHYNGTAKVANLTIEKSIGAWEKLFAISGNEMEEILDILALLQKAKKELESKFPNFQSFIRPGFDE
ncbi:MAG: hypothetical protein EA341_12360 [Mongoliibacter sp.]|uniref:hypothetical protein n=1 Tax=Mongoliibacter sp. TaxID=2022438 RepID=UPI0012F45F90|nr:hypothetical protein [Mongoliibacter sp.]TVP47598.1 MAG: hypothetical protein EA341_12360 [Mongoliibacter sp.]